MAAIVEIVDGPSKWDGLILSLAEGDCHNRSEVSFTIIAKVQDHGVDGEGEIVQREILGWVNGLKREDGSSYSWIVELLVISGPDFIAKPNETITLWFDVRKRKGYIQL